jgi:putative hydrolase of the HAD superfamily
VYAEAFRRHGLEVSVAEVHAAGHAVWAEVAAMGAEGKDRWRAEGGERGFWRRFVQEVFTRVGGGTLPLGLLRELVHHFRDERSWTIYPEVHETLARLREAGLALHVLSNWDSSLPELLSRLGLARLFDGIFVSALVGHSKPDERIFRHALSSAGLSANETLHVGDSLEEDYHGAVNAGLLAILLDRKGTGPAGVPRIASLAELPERFTAVLDLDGAAIPPR